MRSAVVIAILLFSSFSFGQKLRFKVIGQKDTTVHLVKYFGKGLYYADTAEMKAGYVEFDGSKQKTGILALFLPTQQMLEFVYNGEEVHIETNFPDLMGNAKIKKSEENKIFLPYVKFISAKRTEANKWTEERAKLDANSDEYKRLTTLIDNATKEVVDYQNNIAVNYSSMLVGKIVKMSMDVEIPEAPKDVISGIILISKMTDWCALLFFTTNCNNISVSQ